MKENSVSRIRWITEKSELDTQTIRARLVNNLEEYTGRYSFYERNHSQETALKRGRNPHRACAKSILCHSLLHGIHIALRHINGKNTSPVMVSIER
ncbi:MAG: hypothetical protein ACETWE_14730, partial [Candidatus Bathyarchaeia archaeon]